MCNGCCGPAPAPRTPTPPTRCTSTVCGRHTRSTRCPSRRCGPSTTMVASARGPFDAHGGGGEPIAADGGDAEDTLAQFESAGVDVDALAATLQSDGARNFVKSWDDLLRRIDNQVAAVA